MEPRGVLILHGICLNRHWNQLLARDLRKAGFDPVLNWGYHPYVQGGIASVSKRIALRLKKRFPDGVPPLHGVGHSMGGLLLRHLQASEVLPVSGRIITLGTPHQGAEKAAVFQDWTFFKVIFGSPGQDLRPQSSFLRQLPAAAAGEALAVIGCTDTPEGWSKLIPGDDDGVVEVDSARWEGAQECWMPGARHSFMPFYPRVRRTVVDFLQGRPIPKVVPAGGAPYHPSQDSPRGT